MNDTIRALETYWIPNDYKNPTELRCKFCGEIVDCDSWILPYDCPRCNKSMIATVPLVDISDDVIFSLTIRDKEQQ